MSSRFNQMKPIFLVAAISLGVFAQAKSSNAAPLETAIIAGGCFWCVESDFESVKGVKSAVSGFIGGSKADANYKKITKGGTGHREAVKITFDPDQISYAQILNKFFRSIDPTDAGGQFCDRGASYTTAIFVSSGSQKKTALAQKKAAQNELGKSVVTPVIDATAFYPASDYHQDYYKSGKKILTRFGRLAKKDAYKKYRKACGRDARVKSLWGAAAPFAR